MYFVFVFYNPLSTIKVPGFAFLHILSGFILKIVPISPYKILCDCALSDRHLWELYTCGKKEYRQGTFIL